MFFSSSASPFGYLKLILNLCLLFFLWFLCLWQKVLVFALFIILLLSKLLALPIILVFLIVLVLIVKEFPYSASHALGALIVVIIILVTFAFLLHLIYSVVSSPVLGTSSTPSSKTITLTTPASIAVLTLGPLRG